MINVASGQLTLQNLNDSKALQLFLNSSQSKTQLYNATTRVYTPDWSSTKPVVSAELYVAGTSTNIISSAKSINWYEDNNINPITSGGNYTLGTGNQTLTINGNILGFTSVAFDGSSGSASIPNSTSINISGSAFTFESWVFPRDYTNPTEVYVCNKENQYEVALRGSQRGQHTLQIALMVGGSWAWVDSLASIPLNTWTHIAATYDGTNVNFYVNGVLVKTAANGHAGSIASGTSPLTFGSRQAGAYANELIREARIWNVVRTQANISANFNTSLLGTETGLVGYWKMNEGTGTTISDSTSNANTGTLTGGATWINVGDKSKNISCEVVYHDSGVNVDLTSRTNIAFSQTQVGNTGLQGVDAPEGVLSNDTAVVTTLNDGTGGTYGSPNTATTFTVFQNGTDVTNQYTITQTRTNVTVTEATTSAIATVTNMTADTGSVTFTATRTYFPTITKTFYLSKSKMGVVGNNPTDYWLNTSVNSITAADDGTYDTSTVTFSAESQVGTNAPIAYAARFIIAESTDGTNFTTKYTSGADESSKVYTPSTGLAAVKVTMYQAGGVTVKLDEQTIPVINNGKNSVTLSAWTPQGNVIRNAANTVTAQADLYNGGLPDTGTNYRWVKQNGAATSVIAGAGYEDLDLGKRNLALNSNFASGMWGNRNGNWSLLSPLPDSPSSIMTVTASGLSTSGYASTYSNWITASAGNTFTFSCDFKVDDVTAYDMQYPFIVEFYDSTSTRVQYKDVTVALAGITTFQNGVWYRAKYTATVGDSSTVSITNGSATVTQMRIRLCLFKNGTAYYRNIKVESGNIATPWGIAYEEQPIDTTVDNVMYGRNYLKNTYNMDTLYPWSLNKGSAITAVMDLQNDVTYGNVVHTNISVNATSGNNWCVIQNLGITLPNGKFTIGQTYTMSLMLKNATVPLYLNFLDSNGTNYVQTPNKSIGLNANWTKVTFTFTATATGNAPELYMAVNSTTATGDIYITQAKLEVGTAATDWAPAPEDSSTLNPNVTKGLNSWVLSHYPDAGSIRVVGYTDIQAATSDYRTILPDTTNLAYLLGDNYLGYLKTAVYVSTAKTISTTANIDDSIQLYVNGLSIWSHSGVATPTFSIPLQQGWNTIEFIGKESAGNDLIWNFTSIISSLVDEMNCYYALDYGSLRGNYGIMGYNTSSMVVNSNAVTDTDLFVGIVTYRGATYKDSVTIDDITDPITVVIEGADFFKNGQGTNSYTARLYQNGTEIDTNGTTYTYTWYKYNSNGTQDMSFGGSGSKTGKTITLTPADINVRGDIVCNVS